MVPTPHICSEQAKLTEHLQIDRSCHINCSVENEPNLTLSWYKGQEEISHTSNPDNSTNLSLPLEIQDEGMYSCVAANPVINETIFVNSTQWCPAHAGLFCLLRHFCILDICYENIYNINTWY